MPSAQQRINDWIESRLDEITKLMVDLLKIEAISPDNGGRGEYARASFLENVLERSGFKVTRHEVPDSRVQEGSRLNLTSTLKGRDRSRTLWFLAHLDTVPAGPRELWSTNPFNPIVRDGKIFARGAEDNGQAIGSILLAFRALGNNEITPATNIGVAFLSDEESGSKFGLIPLMDRGIFKPEDMAIVPDAGVSDGSQIEIAEKSILWLKFTVRGRQIHGSVPHKGLNACRAAIRLVSELDAFLHHKYDSRDEVFDPPTSTFEPTKHELNVESVNIIPGVDVQYFDCRVMPCYRLKDVMEDIESLTVKVKGETGASIEVTPVQYQECAPPTSSNSALVVRLRTAIEDLRGVKTRLVGVGGGTLALYLRRIGIQTAVWSTVDEKVHQPNEYCKIDNILADAKVLARVAIG